MSVVSSKLTAGIFVAMSLLWGVSSIADDSSESRARDEKAILALAELADGYVDPVRFELERIPTFDRPFGNPEWDQLSTLKRLEVAYLQAERADAGSGERFLALLSKSLAQEYESVRGDSNLAPYLAVDTETPLRFGKVGLPSRQEVADIPQEAKAAIEAIANYFSVGGAVGTTPDSIERYFGEYLPKDVSVYGIMSEGVTSGGAVKTAFSYVPPDKRNVVIKEIVEDLSKSYEAVWYESALKPYLGGKNPPPNDPRGGPDSSPTKPTRPMPPGGNNGPSGAAENYERQFNESYSEEESSRFNEMGTRVKIFGGGVFGNNVRAIGLENVNPVSIEFVPNKNEEVGVLRVMFTNNEALTYSPVSAEEAHAAFAIIYGTPKSKAYAYNPGKGIGLVGLKSIPFDFGDDGSTLTNYANIVLHPGLVNSDLGYAAVNADAIPSYGRDALLESAKKHCTKVEHRMLSNFFESNSKLIDSNPYVITDVPLVISREDARLTVMRDPESFQGNRQLLRSSFIELRIVTSNQDKVEAEQRYSKDFAKDFYELLPLITKSSYDFSAINRFAAVMAIVRWTQLANPSCQFKPIRDTPKPTPTPAAMIVGKGIIRPIAPLSDEERNRIVSGRLDQAIAKIKSQLKGDVDQTYKKAERFVELAMRMKKLDERGDSAANDSVPSFLELAEYYQLVSELPDQDAKFKAIIPLIALRKSLEAD